MTTARIITGDCLEVLPTLDGFDAVVTDPPYGLSFMAEKWDRGVPPAELWAEVLKVLKPGGPLLAFGGTKTFHRLAVAIEDAGFDLRDCIAWLYGTGFPKHPTHLKPAWEPIIVATVPFDGSIEANRARHGCGGLHPEAGLIPYQDSEDSDAATPQGRCISQGPSGARPKAGENPVRVEFDRTRRNGRWPANVALDETAAAQVEAQSGASRFYYCPKASPADRGQGNTHPTVKPVALMRWLVRLAAPSSGSVLDPFAGSGSTGVACAAEGMDFVGIEKRPDYAEIARRRLDGSAGLFHHTNA